MKRDNSNHKCATDCENINKVRTGNSKMQLFLILMTLKELHMQSEMLVQFLFRRRGAGDGQDWKHCWDCVCISGAAMFRLMWIDATQRDVLSTSRSPPHFWTERLHAAEFWVMSSCSYSWANVDGWIDSRPACRTSWRTWPLVQVKMLMWWPVMMLWLKDQGYVWLAACHTHRIYWPVMPNYFLFFEQNKSEKMNLAYCEWHTVTFSPLFFVHWEVNYQLQWISD